MPHLNYLMPDGVLWSLLAGAVGIILYVYLLYPVLLGAFVLVIRKRPVEREQNLPAVTLIIPAYNEQKIIRAKLENSLQIDYPRERLEIIVASDGSLDGTDEVVGEYERYGVTLKAFTPRAGKISVLNRTIPEATGEDEDIDALKIAASAGCVAR